MDVVKSDSDGDEAILKVKIAPSESIELHCNDFIDSV